MLQTLKNNFYWFWHLSWTFKHSQKRTSWKAGGWISTIFLWCPKENKCSLSWCQSGRCFTYQTTSLFTKSHKVAYLRRVVQYMLDNDLIEPGISNWSSPCILIPKQDGTWKTWKLNSVTKTDPYPIPRIEDCIDKIGNAKFVSKFDLLKGYWQVPWTEWAKDISAFVTPDKLYQYKVMPFSTKNAPATFQKMIYSLLQDLEGCATYNDEVIIYSKTW